MKTNLKWIALSLACLALNYYYQESLAMGHRSSITTWDGPAAGMLIALGVSIWLAVKIYSTVRDSANRLGHLPLRPGFRFNPWPILLFLPLFIGKNTHDSYVDGRVVVHGLGGTATPWFFLFICLAIFLAQLRGWIDESREISGHAPSKPANAAAAAPTPSM